MKIVRKQLTVTEIQPAGTRWDAGTDQVQTTPDGGTTWNNAPGLDIRHADSYRLPPLTGGSAQCDAAARMAAYVNVQVDNFLNAGSLAQAATGALGILLLLLGGAGIIIDAIIAAMDVLITIGATAISTAFNVTTYENLKCTFYCHISADGQMSAAQLADFQADVFANYSSTVYSTMITIGSFTGEVQYSNAGVERTETGDCTSCACPWCYTFDFTATDGGWFLRSTDEGIYVGGSGWEAFCFTLDGTAERVVIQFNFPTWGSATLTDWSCHLDYEVGDGGIQQFVMRQFSGANGGGSTLATTSEFPPANGVSDIAGSGSITPGSMELNVWCSSGDCSGSATIISVTLRGHGTNPFGDDNCI